MPLRQREKIQAVPRALILLVLGLQVLWGTGAQGLTPEARWTLTGPSGPVIPGVPFTVKAEVRLPPGYYQDADSPFLTFEPREPFQTTARASTPPDVRQGKPSFRGTFTLERTVILPRPSPGAALVFDLGWQICQIDGVCLLPAQAVREVPFDWNLPSETGAGFWAALAGAFLGGMLLNLMPCVFPVLALKGLGIASAAGKSRRDRRRDALAFAAGGFGAVFLLGLATTVLAALGQRLDWGFPFQQPVFVWALVLVFSAFALSLLGLWTWSWSPFALARAVPVRGGLARSLSGGAFLVVAAAPCTAPLLGPALGFALAQPPAQIPLFFAAIGLGLTTPLLLLQIVPDWARVLPKAGPWMTVVERIAGILLLATAAYLVWVFGSLAGTGTLVPALLLLSLFAAALVLNRPAAPGWLRRTLTVLAVVLALAGSVLALVPPREGALPAAAMPRGWTAFSRQNLEEALAQGKPVLVDATAAWCATCQVNELAVLDRPDVAAAMDSLGLVRLRADYTRPDPAIRQWLADVGRAGLPVYALYRPGRPVFYFPELLTDENFTRALPVLLAP